MTFRTRLVATLSTITALTMVTAFGTASFAVVRSEERQFDEALLKEAWQEAAEIAHEGGGRTLHITDRGGPDADDVGRLTKYAALYSQDGALVDRTPTFVRKVPSRAEFSPTFGAPFDLPYERAFLRAVVVTVPGPSRSVLLLAASRDDLEKDSRFLHKVMAIVALVSVGSTVLVTWRVVRRLTRGHMAIAGAVRKVAAGDLDARVALSSGDDEVLQLARDIEEMVRRLALLMDGQRRFVAYAAHELRTPLTALYSELQLALRRSRSVDEYRSALEESLDAARHLKALAEDLLAIARASAESDEGRTPVLLDNVVRVAMSWVEQDAEHRAVTLQVDTDGSRVLGRASDIERLLQNLVSNAVRHTADGGRVVVRTRTTGHDVDLTVIDEGPGVAEADRERIFEPFFRSSQERWRHPGSGLGLAIAREIARAHGGDIDVEDGPDGRGALFRVRLQAAVPTTRTVG